MNNNYSFVILADGSIYCAAANLSSNKVSFDKDCLIGSHSIGAIKNNLIQEKIWVRICSILVVGFSHSGSVDMIESEYFPLITTLEYNNMETAAIPMLDYRYDSEWDTTFYAVQQQSFRFTSPTGIQSGWSNNIPDSPVPSLYFSDETGTEVPFMFKNDGIYVELDSNNTDMEIYIRINFPDRYDVQTIGMIIQSEDRNIEVYPPDLWESDGCIIDYYNQNKTPNWKCSAPSGGNINPPGDGYLEIRFFL